MKFAYCQQVTTCMTGANSNLKNKKVIQYLFMIPLVAYSALTQHPQAVNINYINTNLILILISSHAVDPEFLMILIILDLDLLFF